MADVARPEQQCPRGDDSISNHRIGDIRDGLCLRTPARFCVQRIVLELSVNG